MKDKQCMVPAKMLKSCSIYNMLSFVYNTGNVGPTSFLSHIEFMIEALTYADRGLNVKRN